ncbi:acyl carrier protein [Alteromonas sediminis]|uniref:Acyl carrier protein n=1 Tax=Alteromonas sediminis TaxID=2259342 RepID=A0A3N5XWW2_9ALTE|nr:acyl carrier protein [Alteromonas sediminis]RPJ65407.1 acyl carrier protein [Alteromonas sediminis]
MTEQEEKILSQIREILVELFELDEEAIVPEAKLYEDLDIDSIDAVDLLIDLKKTIDVDISSEKFNEVRTVQDVITAFAELSAEAK